MPVDFEEYSTEDGRLDLGPETNAGRILAVLLAHRGVGFTPSELADRTEIPSGSVNPTLSRLKRLGLVRHKGEYWAVADDDRLAAASAAVLGVEAVSTDDTAEGDWYADNPEWAEDLRDLDADGDAE